MDFQLGSSGLVALTALAPHTEEEAGDSGGKSDPGKAGCAALTDLVTNEVSPPRSTTRIWELDSKQHIQGTPESISWR